MSITELLLRPTQRFTAQSADLHHWKEMFPSLDTASGEAISPKIALGLAAFFACVRNISEDVAKLPLHVFRKQGRDRFEQPDHPVDYLLSTAPNDDMTALSFRETLTAHACAFGAGYAEIVQDGGGQPTAFWPLDPTTVKMEREGGQLIYVITVQGKKTVLPALRVLHIHGLGYDGLTGYSIPQLARETLGAILAAQKFAGAFFGNGTWLGGVLQHPEHLSAEALEHLRKSWEGRHKGTERAHKLAILEEGMSYHQFGVPPRDAQMIESQYFGLEQVCRYFRMQPHKIQHLLRATFSNIEHQGLEYVGDTLLPWLVRWEQEIKRKLFLASERALFVKHNVSALLRADAATRAAYYSTLSQIGVYSINEVRALEDMNAIEDGDDHYIQLNMQKLGAPEPESPPPAPAPAADEEDEGEAEVKAEADAEPERARLAQILSAHVPVLADTYRRLLRIEADKVSRARKRGDLADWLPEFYEKHRSYAREAFLVPMGALLATVRLCGYGVPDLLVVEAFLERMVVNHIETSCAEAQSDRVEFWSEDRPEAAARAEIDALLSLLSSMGDGNA